MFGDFWRVKDAPQNDIGYMMGPLIILICGGDQWTGDNRVFEDPGMNRLWERLLVEISPDGLINPYGPNGGWNSTADYRIAMLERLAAIAGDGRYRFGAQKLFNYLRYQYRDPKKQSNDTGAPWLIALASIWADDRVEAIEPNVGSLWTKRGEAIRILHTDKQLTHRLLGNADFRENRGHICCSWYMTGEEWPDKLILRSGWNPGDFFGLIELHPTSFPANPGGIMGLNRWGAPFTQIVTSKGASVENRLLIEDVNQQVKRRYHSDKLRIDEFWRRGSMPDIRSEVTYFEDTPQATYARVRVQNMDGLPVVYEREFVFAKNRFLATREIVTFEESFEARLAPLWNTHNVGPQIGSHGANTFIHQPVANNGTRSMKSPPIDLLVWFAPRKDCELIDRLIDDPRAEACPNQVRSSGKAPPQSVKNWFSHKFTIRIRPIGPERPQITPTLIPGLRMPMNCRRPPTLPAFKSSRTHLKLPCCVLNSLLVRWDGLFLIRKWNPFRLKTYNLHLPFYTDRLRGRSEWFDVAIFNVERHIKTNVQEVQERASFR